MTNISTLVPWGVAVAATFIGAGCDLRWRRLPNALTFTTLIAGFGWMGVTQGWPGLQDAVAGCFLLAIPFVILFIFAGGGAGDAKMMGALGAWLGWTEGMQVLLAVVICGIGLGLLYAWAGRRLAIVAHNLVCIISAGLTTIMFRDIHRAADRLPPVSAQQKMPYGLAIFAGVCLAAGVKFLWGG